MRTRQVIVTLAATALLVPLFPSAAAASPGQGPTADPDQVEARAQSAGGPEVAFGYEVETRGQVQADLRVFADRVDEVLGDARGWTLGGSIGFGEVATNGDFTLILASPGVVENAAPVCSRHYSCRVGDEIFINDENWRNATSAWWDAGGDIATYREYLINHEVGHFLGFGHFDCPGPGESAPVMQQQSIDLEGCDTNGWPLSWERQDLAERYGVAVHDWVFTDVLAGDPHRETIHRIADAGVVTGYADGTYRAGDRVTRAQTAAFVDRALGLPGPQEHHFGDVAPDSEHAPSINAAAEAGIVEGYGDGTYGPGEPVARAQMATMLAEAYGYQAEGEPPFDDVPHHHPHADGIAALAEADVVEGFGDGTFEPGSSVTRGQLASFVVRADENL